MLKMYYRSIEDFIKMPQKWAIVLETTPVICTWKTRSCYQLIQHLLSSHSVQNFLLSRLFIFALQSTFILPRNDVIGNQNLALLISANLTTKKPNTTGLLISIRLLIITQLHLYHLISYSLRYDSDTMSYILCHLVSILQLKIYFKCTPKKLVLALTLQVLRSK